MKQNIEFYVAPEAELLSYDPDGVLCTSGMLNDYTIEDFDWEGMGNE